MDLLKDPDLVNELGPLLSAEAEAEAPGAGVDAADLEQAVWVRLLESGRRAPDPADPAHRRHRTDDHRPRTGAAAGGPGPAPEDALLHGEENRALRSAVARLPGRCPELMKALLSPRDLTYREIAGELGISQGSLGPVRSRCLGCLRRMLAAEVAAPGLRGMER